MVDWLDYDVYSRDLPQHGQRPHTVAGNVKAARAFRSPQLNNKRDILVYLPPSYTTDSERRYPVLYMHDGQNLFDEATSFAGEWHVDEIMEEMSREGIEAIVVGIPNAGIHRLNEYSPFRDAYHGGGKGRFYVDFIVDTLKPAIDAEFRTCDDRGCTGIMGSSMGGLISLYAFFYRPDAFGFAGVMSPSVWFANRAIYPWLESAPFVDGRIYLDAGTREMSGSEQDKRRRANSRRYYASVRRLQRILYKKGYQPQRQLLYVQEQWAFHQESAWTRRLPNALRFLLQSPAAVQPPAG